MPNYDNESFEDDECFDLCFCPDCGEIEEDCICTKEDNPEEDDAPMKKQLDWDDEDDRFHNIM